MNASSPSGPFPASRAVALWLWLVCTLVVIMVAVGGITRITESGLSMVNWRPITGTLPPGSTAEWEAEFDQYKDTPQFEKFNAEAEMTLDDFKQIYFWEWFHRVLGRVIGMAYALPLFGFLLLGKIPKVWRGRLWLGLVLGGAQGVLGWFMVKSGLIDKPYVSHFRLAAHLSLALFVLCYLLWIVFSLQPFWTHRHTNFHRLGKLRQWVWAFVGLVVFQVMYGAFTAGLRAGYAHNTWPRMSGRFFPPEAAVGGDYSWFSNWLYNPVAVQFIHRNLAWVVVGAAFALWLFALKQRISQRQKLAFNGLMILLTVQFLLGVFTLLSGMNIVIAVAHQVNVCLFLGSLVWVLHEITGPKTVTSLRS